MRLLAALSVLLLAMFIPWPVDAGWGPAGCGPVGRSAPVAPPLEGWHASATDPGKVYLYRAGRIVAGWNPEAGTYHEFVPTTGGWGPAQPPPWKSAMQLLAPPAPKPCGPGCQVEMAGPITEAEDRIMNFGVETGKLSGRREESYWASLGGAPARKIMRHEALAMLGNPIGADGIPNDADLPRLTVIGSDADRAQVVKDLDGSPALAGLKGKLVVQAYPPDHWSVRPGFVTTGKPTIYLQAPDGHVLHRQDDYQGGPEALAEAIRKADPSYDKSKDPDLRKPSLPLPWKLPFSIPEIPEYVWALLVVGVVVFLTRYKKP